MNNLQILRWRKDESPSSGHTLFVNISFIMSMLLNLLMLTGCSTTSSLFSAPQQQQFEIKSTANDLNSGRISLFLNLKNAPARHGIHMQVSKIEILNETTWLPIAIKIQDINAEKIDKHQLFLGRGQLPTGNYHRLRFTLSQQASSLRDDGKRILLNVKSPIVEINLPSVLDLNQGDSHSLFVTWDEANSLPSPPFLQPAWSISPNKKQMSTDIAYAACPAINTIYVIRTDKNWVCNSFGINGHPSCISATANQATNRLYILSPTRAEIDVVELLTNFIVNTFQIPMTSNPANMIISKDEQWAYILDNQEDYLLQINLSSGELEKRIQLGFQPNFITCVPSHNLLAISSKHSQTLTLLNSNTLDKVGEIQTTGTPEEILAWNGMLYITEGTTNTVAIYDLNHQTILSRVNVGFYPHHLLQNDEHIYVSNRDSNSISVLQPGQLGISHEISLSGTPLKMMVAQNSRWLYAVNKNIGGLTVIDATSNQINGQILFGAVPMGLTVVQ